MEILKKYIWPLSFLFLLFACEEREEPEPISGAPVFYLIGEFNGEPFKYYAGNGAVNEAFSYQDSAGNFWFASRFITESGLNDSQQSEFQFEFALTSNKGNDPEFVTDAGRVAILKDSIRNYFEVEFKSEITNPDYSYTWNFGDGTSSTEMNPIHRFPMGKSDYSVCLSIENNDNCVAEICQNISPYLNGNLDINANQAANELWIFEPEILGFEAIVYEWKLSNGNTIKSRQIALQTDTNETMELCLKAISRASESYEKCIQVNTGINPDACISNFDFTSEVKTDTFFSQAAERIISGQLTLNNSSLEIADFEENYFEIIDSEPFLSNQNDEATRKVRFQLELRLIDENGLFNHLKITDGVMAVGA